MIDELILSYALQPHPEGGFYRETYRSRETMPVLSGELRNASTAIYYLLPKGQKSRLHRIKSDEIWHFYGGDPLIISEIFPDGTVRETLLGSDVLKGQVPQHMVPAGNWFGAQPAPESRFSFCGCTVSPGFDFKDFEMGSKEGLRLEFPEATKLIESLT